MRLTTRIINIGFLILMLGKGLQAGGMGMGQKVDLGANVKVSEDVVIGVRAGSYLGKHLEQLDAFQGIYDSSGTSGMEYAISGRLQLGNLGKMKITGMGEVAYYNRDVVDSTLNDALITKSKLTIVLPRSGILVEAPIAGDFLVQFNNTFERRLISSPLVKSYWFWRPQIRLFSPAFTQMQIRIFGDYEGIDNEDLAYTATYAFGIKMEPIKNLDLNLENRFAWKPAVDYERTLTDLISLKIQYTFDLSK